MGKQEAFRNLAMKLVNSAGQQIMQLVPGVHAVCITLIGKGRDIPLGGIVCHPDHLDSATLLRGIARMSDHTEILARKLLGEDSNGFDADGQDRPSLAEQGQAERVADAGDGSPDQEDLGEDEAAAGGEG